MEERRYEHFDSELEPDRGEFVGEFKEVVDFKDATTYPCEKTLDSHKIAREKKAVWDRIEGAIQVIADEVNHVDPRYVGQMIATGLANNHRTLQAQTVSALLIGLRRYADAPYDLRNRSAVLAATKVRQMLYDEAVFIELV